MVFFITFLRALAACLITNSHYTGVYPTDIIANGGLLGDIIFFAVSGYCLYNIKVNFLKWYGKKLWRIYLPVILITIVYILFGFYKVEDGGFFWWFVYPTNYHFVASIVMLYIPFYIICKWDFTKQHIGLIMAIVFIIAMIFYVFFYEKSYYHIDTVREPFIRLLFFESMLLGAYFKQNDEKYRNKTKSIYLMVGALVGSLFLYFASKVIFSKYDFLSHFQIVNQIVIFAVLYFLFRVFSAFDANLEKSPQIIKKPITFIAQNTLEIYIVQNVLIAELRNVSVFPINWFLLTIAILLSSFLLHTVCKFIYGFVDAVMGAIREKVRRR